MVRRAFTLIELLVVVGIIATISAIAMPALVSVRDAAYQFAAVQSIRGLAMATSMYSMDHDDTYPLAMYQSADGLVAWFGAERGDGTFDPARGLLAPYSNGRAARDASFKAYDYLGDHSGFGYNWGAIGSDFNITGDYTGFPNCQNPARANEIERPSEVVGFATSAYFFAPWLPDGDGAKYDFGFIDPPRLWDGRPNVDFRFGGKPEIDLEARELRPTGTAVFLFLDGSAKTRTVLQVEDAMFERSGYNPSSGPTR